MTGYRLAYLLPLLALGMGCDGDVGGEAFANQPPDTELAVQDRSLVDNISNRLSSTLTVNWSGTDPDGYVEAYEIRFFDASGAAPAPNAGWSRTTARDTTVLLPIQRGQSVDDVAFEVRSVDNDGDVDPTPASTIYPIKNGRPILGLSESDLPPDTTLGVISFSFSASDPEGDGDLQRFEIGLNDSTTYVDLGIEATFFTIVSDAADAGAQTATARVFAGRAFRATGVTLSGLRLDADNTLYIRAVDATEAFSDTSRVEFYAKRRTSNVLFINDVQSNRSETTVAFHSSVLAAYSGSFDTYTLTDPDAPLRSRLLPRLASPTMTALLAQYDHVYFVSQSVIGSARTESFAFAAPALAQLVERGGSVLVVSPTSLVDADQANPDNPAFSVLPIVSNFIRPDSILALEIPRNGEVRPASSVPGTGASLPVLTNVGRPLSLAPLALASDVVPLYSASLRFTAIGQRPRDWTGASAVAAMTRDRTVGFMALALIDSDGTVRLGGNDDSAPREALRLMLEGLRFPTN